MLTAIPSQIPEHKETQTEVEYPTITNEVTEVIKRVEVEVEKEVIKTVPVPFEVVKEVIKEVPVEKEVIKEVEVALGLWSQSFGVFDVGGKSAVELRLAVRARAQLGGGGGQL